MIVGGDWLVTAEGAPIRGGAVVTHGGRITEVGTYAALTSVHRGVPAEYFRGCVLTPGLVNAHTHLSLTVLGGLVASAPLPEWLGTVTKAVRAMTADDFAASTALGALECLACGVTTVGDIAYGPEALATAADAGLAGTFFWEVLGITADGLARDLAEREFPSERASCTSERTRCGISPHSPYTSGPGLLRAASAAAHAKGAPFAIHLAESPAERQLLERGRGPFLATAHRLAPDFHLPRLSPVAYAHSLGVLKGALAIHCVDTDAADIATLKADGATVALCPRSNAYLHNGAPPVAALSDAGVNLAVGTDSAASNGDLDLLEEAREVRRLGVTVTSRRLVRMITSDAAAALGLGSSMGTLAVGKQADIAVFRLGQTEDPETALLLHGGRRTLQAVCSGGVWRIRDGRACLPTSAAERAGARVRARLASVLNGS